MASATITSKGQVTIPKEVRDALQVHAGDVIDFRREGDGSFRVQARKVQRQLPGGDPPSKGP